MTNAKGVMEEVGLKEGGRGGIGVEYQRNFTRKMHIHAHTVRYREWQWPKCVA